MTNDHFPFVDNEIYNRHGDIWWDDNEVLSLLRLCLNPARFGYFSRILRADIGIDPGERTALDVGCGGGLLAEEFARLGCRVTGIDPSEPSLETARAHARRSGLDIEYVPGAGESLPFADASFDIVYCCDVLEHVDDLEQVTAESARVLKPGGVYLFDTINRTVLSNLIVIKLLQEWEWTSFVPPNLHAWEKFIKPDELRACLSRHDLALREVKGMKPRAGPLTLFLLVRRLKKGKIGLAEFGRAVPFLETWNTSVSYMGYALKGG
jgi:2-polyprenyl-6-hydroxyphenyl methylase/3-demethylubiquinone-9 3-methyltransferase